MYTRRLKDFMPDLKLLFERSDSTFSDKAITVSLLMKGTHTLRGKGTSLLEPLSPPRHFSTKVIFSFNFNARGEIRTLSKVFDKQSMYRQLGWSGDDDTTSCTSSFANAANCPSSKHQADDAGQCANHHHVSTMSSSDVHVRMTTSK